MPLPSSILAAIPPQTDRLLEIATTSVSESMLTEIAYADYGFGADENELALRDIVRRRSLPPSMPFDLVEVLQLTRWNTLLGMGQDRLIGDQPAALNGTGVFVSSLLLWAGANREPAVSSGAQDCDVACLVRSIGVTNRAALDALAAFFVAVMERSPETVRDSQVDIGLAVTLLLRSRGRPMDSALPDLLRWTVALDAEQSQAIRKFSVKTGYPIETPPPSFGVLSGFWRPIVAFLRDTADGLEDRELADLIQLCSLLVNDEGTAGPTDE